VQPWSQASPGPASRRAPPGTLGVSSCPRLRRAQGTRGRVCRRAPVVGCRVAAAAVRTRQRRPDRCFHALREPPLAPSRGIAARRVGPARDRHGGRRVRLRPQATLERALRDHVETTHYLDEVTGALYVPRCHRRCTTLPATQTPTSETTSVARSRWPAPHRPVPWPRPSWAAKRPQAGPIGLVARTSDVLATLARQVVVCATDRRNHA
jgi:hypothetical protein